MGYVAKIEAEDVGVRGAASDMREAPRYTLLIRTAKLVCESGEYLCVVRDASATGIKVRLFHPLPVQSELTLELANGERFPVERVWETGGDAGLRFTVPVDVSKIVAEEFAFRKRPVRLRVKLAASIRIHGDRSEALVHDLSQQGAQIHSARHLAVGQQVCLEVEHLAPIIAKVRWRRHPAYGLVFEQTFRLDEFARVAAVLCPPLSAGASPDALLQTGARASGRA